MSVPPVDRPQPVGDGNPFDPRNWELWKKWKEGQKGSEEQKPQDGEKFAEGINGNPNEGEPPEGSGENLNEVRSVAWSNFTAGAKAVADAAAPYAPLIALVIGTIILTRGLPAGSVMQGLPGVPWGLTPVTRIPVGPDGTIDPNNIPPEAWGSINLFGPGMGAGGFGYAENTPFQSDPLILDLNGDGIKTTTFNEGTFFDFNNNNFAEWSTWVDQNDGILVIDSNANGKIDNGTEIVGVNDGYAALTVYDTNADGTINSSDTNFSQLKVLKGDGSLLTLAQANIASLNLAHTTTGITDANGNTQVSIGSYTKTNNATGLMGDYKLLANTAVSNPLSGVAVPDDIKLMPNVMGYGNVYDLSQAMAMDNTGVLKSLVEAFIKSSDTNAQNELLDQILAKWAGVPDQPINSRNGFAIGTHISVVEKFEGHDFQNTPGGFVPTIPSAYIAQEYNDLREMLYAKLMSQTQLAEYIGSIVWDVSGDDEYSLDLTPVAAIIDQLAVTDRTKAISVAVQFSRTVFGLGWTLFSNYQDFYQQVTGLGSDFAEALLTSYRQVITGDNSDNLLGSTGTGSWDTGTENYTRDAMPMYLSGGGGNDSLKGTYNDDVFDGGTGNDIMRGFEGNDVYYFGVGSGSDTIEEGDAFLHVLNVGYDTVYFTGNVTATDLTFLIEGYDLIIRINNTADQLTIKDQFNPTTPDKKVENIAFANGTSISTDNINLESIKYGTNGADYLSGTALNDKMYGYDGNDTITAGVGNDTLLGGNGDDTIQADWGDDVITGGQGNDYIVGSLGSDTYVFNAGDGIDAIYESDTLNTLQFGTGITLANTVFTPGPLIDDLTITFVGSTDKIVISGQLASGAISTFAFSDTTTLSSTDVLNRLSVSGDNNANLIYGSAYNESVQGYDGDDTISVGLGNDTIWAGGGNDYIQADWGDDVIDGGTGIDTMDGSAGNDIFIVDNSSDLPRENANEGTDLVQASASFTLGNNIENLTLTGSANINGTGNTSDNVINGNTGNNSLSGGSGADTLDGGAGTDTLVGGLGNDTFIVDTTTDTITENVSEGTDIVHSSVTYTLGSNIENLTLTGTGDINGTGNTLNNVITGNSGNNSLNGGSGTDTLIGGFGNDIYVVDSTIDTITENASEGTDTVQSSVTYTLGANLENLTLTASGAINGTGNTLANYLTGGSGNNSLSGGDGNDTLDGASGTDTLVGGIGNDTFIVDSTTDTITEASSAGTDTVQSSVTYTLGSNIENLVLTGSNAINGTGNTLANYLTGNAGNNSLSGSDGNDTLDGGAGTDTLVGGIGNDTFIVDSTTDTVTEAASAGTDTVQSSVTYTLGSNLENLTLTGTGNIDGTGNTLNNVLTGNSGNNSLNGGTGTDTLIGGLGNDTYIVDSTTDTITENSAEGIDTVQSSVTYTLGSNLENLILTASTAVNGTGNTLDNYLTGGSGNNSLSGGDGNDTLNGSTGTDTLVGGLGNDTFIVDTTTDTITEASNAGTDTIQSSVTYTLGSNLENLTLTASTAINGTGNTLDNYLTGGSGNNSLSGSSGTDTLDGGAGIDTLVGGTGNDTFIVDTTTDTITENSAEGTDTVQSSVTYTLGSNLENLTLTGSNAINGTGNTLDNYLTGNAGNNSLSGGSGVDTLDGGAGVDTLVGGIGNDTFIVDTTTDTITENAAEGTDTVQSSISYTLGTNLENLTLAGSANINATGNSLNNVLTGNSGDNTLDGSTGVDTLIGGLGNDTYIIDDTNDVITENASAGVDLAQSSVTYTLSANVENLTLTGTGNINGTGNALNNIVTGNSGNNTLDGNTGVDTLIGGFGNDIYVVDSTTDTITENASEGTDTVQSGVTYTLGSNVENLTLTGTSAINGIGNALANSLTGNSGNNSLAGADGNDTLDGGAGTDTLAGGIGDDTYIVDSTTDTITELSYEGIDVVQSSVTYTLSSTSFLENLTLTGSGNINGTGNTLDNNITGNSGNNSLSGGSGNDTLDGGAGIDTLVGGTGNDLYYVDNVSDSIIENASEGTDSILSSVSYALASNVENLTLTGTNNINAIGNSINNFLTGNSGNNSLTGGTGNDTLDGYNGSDTLIGGDGNDWYFVDTSTDVIVEANNEGQDTVVSDITYSLDSNLENLILQGLSNINGTGNNISNYITGNYGNNSLSGGSGNDTLDGSAGIDTLVGGIGDDTYMIYDNNDVITENAAEGFDTVISSVNYSLSENNIEALMLTGITAVSATGNSLENTLTGNSLNNTLDGGAGIDSLIGGLGNDTLDGGVGIDTLIGGLGNDTYLVDNTSDVIVENSYEGTDTVFSSANYTLSSNIENLTLNGSSGINATGNSMANILTGNTGDNVISGDDGNDTVLGDAGNDTLYGDFGYDSLLGGSGNDVLYGGDQNDTLDGGTGADTLQGGLGDDTYIVDDLGDVIIETSGEGMDSVYSNFTYTLGSTLENLHLTGSSNINATGNDSANELYGNDGNNTLAGGLGNDMLAGSGGNDTYIFNAGDGSDAIYDTQGVNSIQIGSGLSYSDAVFTVVGNDLVISFTSSSDQITIANQISYVCISQVTFLADNTVLTDTDLLNLSVIPSAPIYGDASDNYLTGTNDSESLLGQDGNDTLNANAGNDTLKGGNGNDNLWAGNGNDSLLGEAGNDYLTGDDGSDTLVGGTGNDTMYGFAGNDTYIFNVGDGQDTISDTSGTNKLKFGSGITQSNIIFSSAYYSSDIVITFTDSSDKITLSGQIGAGTEKINSFVFADNSTLSDTDILSRLVMYGDNTDNSLSGSNYAESIFGQDGNDNISGNSGNDSIWGGSGNDTIGGNDGDDSLIGGTGNDTLYGGSGIDTFVFNVGDGQDYISDDNGTNTLKFGTGITQTNTIFSSAYYSSDIVVSFTDSSDKITLGGQLGSNKISSFVFGDNSTLSDSDILSRLSTYGDNTANNISGSNYAESIFGQDGNDTLYGNMGNDTLSGGTGNDYLSGDDGNDVLIGGTGNDTLYGWAGNDTYKFSKGDGIDTVYDVSSSDTADLLTFDNTVSQSEVAIWMNGNNLEIGYTSNSTDKITVQYQNSSTIEKLELSNGYYLTDANINQIIQDMTTYATNNSISLTSLNDVKNDANLLAIVNNGWHT